MAKIYECVRQHIIYFSTQYTETCRELWYVAWYGVLRTHKRNKTSIHHRDIWHCWRSSITRWWNLLNGRLLTWQRKIALDCVDRWYFTFFEEHLNSCYRSFVRVWYKKSCVYDLQIVKKFVRYWLNFITTKITNSTLAYFCSFLKIVWTLKEGNLIRKMISYENCKLLCTSLIKETTLALK